MDSLTTEGGKLAPKDTPEGVAIFRAQVIGPLLTRVFSSHGDLASAIRMLARERHLPPGASTTRHYSETTIERWYYRFKKHGLRAWARRTRRRARRRQDVCAAGAEAPSS